jgi:hypothetical protein
MLNQQDIDKLAELVEKMGQHIQKQIKCTMVSVKLAGMIAHNNSATDPDEIYSQASFEELAKELE